MIFGKRARAALEEKLAEEHRKRTVAQELHANCTRYARRNAEVLRRHKAELAEARAVILKLTADLRQMDQLIWQMAQQSSWEAMSPHFANLLALCTARMKAESDQIKAALIPRIVETYANAGTKSMAATEVFSRPSEPAKLEGPRDATATRGEGWRDNEALKGKGREGG